MKKNGVGLAVLALFATLTHAEDYLSPTEERVRLSLGIVRVSNNTDLQVDSSAGVPGTPINAAVARRYRAVLAGMWSRPYQRHSAATTQ